MTVPRFVDANAPGGSFGIDAYDFSLAGLLDAAGVDAILVGDSLGMVVQGKRTTLPLSSTKSCTMPKWWFRAGQRRWSCRHALHELSDQPMQAVENAGAIIKRTGASAVKLEAGVHQAATIAALSAADIPVMAHVGLKPQSVLKLGVTRFNAMKNSSWPTPAPPRMRGRSPSCSSAFPARLPKPSPPSCRSRRLALAPGPPATDRCSSRRTCSG